MHLLNKTIIMLTKNSMQRIITGMLLIAALFILFSSPAIVFSCALIVALSIMLAELKVIISDKTSFYLLAPWYPVLPCMILIYFNQNALYRNLLIYLFMLVFSFDTGCYLAGNLCNRFWKTRKIVPSISPGKSYEGFFAGYLVTTLILLYITKQECQNLLWHSYILSAIICIIAFVGDIFESYLKRKAGLKDSGTILPGHGGMLDRFDAVLAVSYFFFVCKDYLIDIFQN